MKRILKLSLYVIGCILIFFIIASRTGNTPKELVSQNIAQAFEWEKKVTVYFPKRSDMECTLVYPRERMVINAETLAPGAFQALLDGITSEEEKEGYVNSIPQDVLVNSFEIKDRVAYIDVSQNFLKGLQNSCRKEAVMAQIDSTLKALRDIERVLLLVDGEVVVFES